MKRGLFPALIAVAALAILTSWFRGEPQSRRPGPRRTLETQTVPEPEPPQELETTFRQLEKPSASAAPGMASEQPSPVPSPAQPWRPGYMGMNGIDTPAGEVVVTQVFAYTAAERTGLQVGDVVVEFNGRAIPNLAALFQLARDTGEGAPVSLRVRRAGTDLYLGLQLGRHPLYN